MKILKRKKQEQKPVQKKKQASKTEAPIEKDLIEPTPIPETYKEYYPLLFPHSFAAIVEDGKYMTPKEAGNSSDLKIL